MSDECFSHGFGGDLPKRDRSDEFKEAIRDNQQVVVFAWGRDKFVKNIDGHNVQRRKGRENFHWLVVSAEDYPVFGACYAAPHRGVAVYRNERPVQGAKKKIL